MSLPESSAQWTHALGQQSVQMGVHPVSDGAFEAARFLLGERMIELLAPVAGVESDFSRTLARRGEGASALALPVADVEQVRGLLEARGVRVFHSAPHWFVHPADCAGVLVQLTPRVQH